MTSRIASFWSNEPEFALLVMLALVGMMLMISANDLMSLYMAVELQSLPLYVVAAMRTNSLRSSEAGLKYFLLGALSSGMLLYGASLVYGYAGTTSFSGIAYPKSSSPSGSRRYSTRQCEFVRLPDTTLLIPRRGELNIFSVIGIILVVFIKLNKFTLAYFKYRT